MKTRYWVLLALVVLVGGFAALSYSWTFTPYGRLDYMAAISTRGLSINVPLRPDPKSDLKFEMPIIFALGVAPLLPKESVSETRDVSIPDGNVNVPARLYRPKGHASAERLPVIVYYHGGGFVLGDIDIFDALARSLSNATQSVVVSVGYRLAPAHPYPAGVDDAYAGLLWAAANARSFGGDASKVAVAGDSAGGNLATVVALMARDRGGPPLAAEILYYPVTDLTNAHYKSADRFTDGYGLSRSAAAAFNRAYIPAGVNPRDPLISPLYAPDLSRLPPVLVLTGGFDPLTDSTKVYIARLNAAGVPVTWRHYPDIIHGFMSSPLFRQRRLALAETASFWAHVPAHTHAEAAAASRSSP